MQIFFFTISKIGVIVLQLSVCYSFCVPLPALWP